MTPDRAANLDRVRTIVLALPGSVEKVSHGQPVFFIDKGRIFVWFMDDHHGSAISGVAVKTSGLEEQAMLIERDPDLYYRPAYLGPSGWIGIRLSGGETDWDHVAAWIERSWRAVAPRRLTEERPE